MPSSNERTSGSDRRSDESRHSRGRRKGTDADTPRSTSSTPIRSSSERHSSRSGDSARGEGSSASRSASSQSRSSSKLPDKVRVSSKSSDRSASEKSRSSESDRGTRSSASSSVPSQHSRSQSSRGSSKLSDKAHGSSKSSGSHSSSSQKSSRKSQKRPSQNSQKSSSDRSHSSSLRKASGDSQKRPSKNSQSSSKRQSSHASADIRHTPSSQSRSSKITTESGEKSEASSNASAAPLRFSKMLAGIVDEAAASSSSGSTQSRRSLKPQPQRSRLLRTSIGTAASKTSVSHSDHEQSEMTQIVEGRDEDEQSEVQDEVSRTPEERVDDAQVGSIDTCVPKAKTQGKRNYLETHMSERQRQLLRDEETQRQRQCQLEEEETFEGRQLQTLQMALESRRLEVAAVKLQAAARGWKARKELTAKRKIKEKKIRHQQAERKRQAILTVERRKVEEEKRRLWIEEEALAKKKVAIKRVQAWIRGFLVRRLIRTHSALFKAARQAEAEAKAKAAKQLKQQQERAALDLKLREAQALRREEAKKRAHAEKRNAATKIQALWRSYVARKAVSQHRALLKAKEIELLTPKTTKSLDQSPKRPSLEDRSHISGAGSCMDGHRILSGGTPRLNPDLAGGLRSQPQTPGSVYRAGMVGSGALPPPNPSPSQSRSPRNVTLVSPRMGVNESGYSQPVNTISNSRSQTPRITAASPRFSISGRGPPPTASGMESHVVNTARVASPYKASNPMLATKSSKGSLPLGKNSNGYIDTGHVAFASPRMGAGESGYPQASNNISDSRSQTPRRAAASPWFSISGSGPSPSTVGAIESQDGNIARVVSPNPMSNPFLAARTSKGSLPPGKNGNLYSDNRQISGGSVANDRDSVPSDRRTFDRSPRMANGDFTQQHDTSLSPRFNSGSVTFAGPSGLSRETLEKKQTMNQANATLEAATERIRLDRARMELEIKSALSENPYLRY